MFDKLFEPIKIRDMELRNRVVMSAMGTTSSSNTEDGKMVTDNLVTYHAARARGGCGMNTVEVTSVDMASSPACYLSIADDKYVPGFKKLTDAVHAEGGKACLQLWQGGMAVSSDPSAEILSASPLPISPEVTIPEVTTERLNSIIKAYGDAAKRAVDAGFDAVEFHCGHNYLPHCMLSGGFNHRTDEWGGSFENRKKFPLACIRSIRANIPEGMPVFMRIDCHDDMLEGGLTVEEVIDFCKDAGKAGVDVLNITRGNISTAASIYEVAPLDIQNGFNVEVASRIRKETGLLTMPCGRINKPELAEQILEEDKADMVIMSRAQLADPEFCNKAKAGRLNAITYCLGCDQGCFDRFFMVLADPSFKHISCTRNPAVLEEATMTLKKTDSPKKVLIAGGGIAGIEAAGRLVECGHTPVIYEAGDQLGGQFRLAGIAPRKDEFRYACEKAIENLKDENVEIHLNSPVDADVIAKEKPDAVILATGSTPIMLKVPGIENVETISAQELLGGKEVNAATAVVIGGGLVGIESAEYLASKGVKVTIVEMRDEILTEMGLLRKISTQMAMAQEPITVMTGTTCKALEKGKVIAENKDGKVEIEADVLIMAVGSRSKDVSDLEEACEKLGIPCYKVGDAKATGLAMSAIHGAYDAVMEINK